MADPRWMAPPEVVAAIFEMGPGPASVLANQLVWVTEAISHELMMGLSAANAGATATQWMGGGGIASLTSAFGLNAGLQTLVGWVTHKIAVTQAAADAFTLALSTVIPSLVAQTNRDETATLHATNFMGVNTPAIIERDTEYFGDYWPQNSSVGMTYANVLAGLMANLGLPPPPAPMGASPAAPMLAGTSAAQSAARAASGGLTSAAGTAADGPAQAASSTGGDAASMIQQVPQLFSTLAEQAQSFAGMPASALQSFTSVPQMFTSLFASLNPTGGLGAEGALANVAAAPIQATAGVATGGTGAVGGVGSYPAASLATYTRPSSTFSPELGGRPAGRAGALNAAELRAPVTTSAMGGTPMPMSGAGGAGMLGRAGGEGGERDQGPRARILVGPQPPNQDPPEGELR